MMTAVWMLLATFALGELTQYQVLVEGDIMNTLSVMNQAVAESESLFTA